MKITRHARKRMDEMGVPDCDVVEAVRSPHLTYPTRYGDGHRMNHVRGEISVLVDRDLRTEEPVVITVLWHRAEGDDQVHAPRRQQ